MKVTKFESLVSNPTSQIGGNPFQLIKLKSPSLRLGEIKKLFRDLNVEAI